jgi:hypothetical protein
MRIESNAGSSFVSHALGKSLKIILGDEKGLIF